MIIRTISLVIVLAVMLTGCASTTELADKPIQLQSNQGIAAIMLNAPHRITQITYAAKAHGATGFEVPDTQGGPALYLVPVQAGRYCLKHFRYWRVVFKSTQELGCLTVVAGHITYGGEIVPSIGPDHAITDQQFNLAAFTGMLHKQYPVLAGMYPLASAPPPPAGVDATAPTERTSTWTQVLPGGQNQAVYVQNNTSWTIELTDLNLIVCRNIAASCGPHSLNMMIGPFARKQVMLITPADGTLAYSYRYDFSYVNAD
ncbi:MAG TPA: hypothetical protein VFX47_05100 [Gammaproteobacteria bacterium]|nr:hypothetical protein [Gammaproteobacteria bacterium]